MTTNHTTPHHSITHSLTQTKPHQINYLINPNQHVYLVCSVHICAQPIYFAYSVQYAKLTLTSICTLFICRMSFLIPIPRSSPTLFFVFRICELTLSPCLVFVQFNASCRAICLLFSFRLFLAILWACHRFLFFF
ncbi:hypothetical protein DFJ58DRAFT_253215 [Suillus subalutaceus]|uniref:uncharacterized protein n=1 Tax=Suillus subalutaceus TaxID=48586 RepID=UPI001B86CDE3|nr:uncharacterized protein DFJ58DRAFT_253215 [Suillus subalutaceus]KAG1830928.1 hypothetical protein DFJ58DRAFT_253215 [Suillus subalutaceus]